GAGIAGALAERRPSARERRHLALTSLDTELRSSASVLNDPQFTASDGEPPRRRVYRRLPTSATGSALTSGALADRGDEELLRRLHQWRDAANGFNRRLDLTELRIFLTAKLDEVRQFDRTCQENDGSLARLRTHPTHLQQFPPPYVKPSPPQHAPTDQPPD